MSLRYLADYLEASASRYADRVAVVDSCGGSITYAELNRRADALAGTLFARGVKRGDRVGMVVPKGIEAVVSMFGIMKAGAAYVPVDYSSPAKRVRRILTDCRVRAVIVNSTCLDVVPEEDGDLSLAVVIVVGKDSAAGKRSGAISFAKALEKSKRAPDHERSPADLAYILYTSGSTGMPKGVMITHGNAMSFIEWCSLAFTPTEHDRVSNHAPFYFDSSVFDIYLAIKHGGSLYLVSEALGRNPRELARFISANKLTVWSSTPSALMMLIHFGSLDTHDMSHLRLVTFGGEVFPLKHLRELRRHWTSPDFINLYGPTEITTACTFARIPKAISTSRLSPYPIGFPCSHCRALVLDDQGREVVPGHEGLLHISGPSVFIGYWNRPEDTAAAFRELQGVRWYNTGDIVKWDGREGFTYVGRNDGMVKRRGFRIELGEIENALYQHSRFLEAAVVSVPDADEGVKILAFLSCPEGEPPSTIDLKTFCADRLPAYMIPDRFLFVERLPRTSTDKVDYMSLKGQFLAASVG
jgi:amino acid adenylation domain-containing protein